jgi:hypothetical protein
MRMSKAVLIALICACASSIAAASTGIVNTPGDGFLGLRSQPTAKSGKRLAKIPHRTALTLERCEYNSQSQQWCYTSYKGQSGWVMAKYVNQVPASAPDISARGASTPKEKSADKATRADFPRTLELFGVALKGATRDHLRQAFKDNGLRAIREEDGYWVDLYDAQGVLEGASDFKTGYLAASGTFAFAEYTFPGFMDTQLVAKVIDLVATKYGAPSSQSGNYGLGNVTARWNLGQGMAIDVSRGWPDTTTYLSFVDKSAEGQMAAEIEAEKKVQRAQKAKEQSRAF